MVDSTPHASSPERPAGSTRPDPDARVVVRPVPKVVFFYLTWLASLAFLVSAYILRMKPDTTSNVECPNAFCRIDFMCRDRKQIAADLFDIDRNFSGCLNRVRMEPDLFT